MNHILLGKLFNNAEDDDSIAIFFENRNITLLKKVISTFQFYNSGCDECEKYHRHSLL